MAYSFRCILSEEVGISDINKWILILVILNYSVAHLHTSTPTHPHTSTPPHTTLTHPLHLPHTLHIHTTHTITQFHDIIKEVQAETEQLPETQSVRVTLDPFSPPSTPLEKTPGSGEENPIANEAFVGVSPEKYQQGNFEHFLGDPFQILDPFAENGPHTQNHAYSSSEESESDRFVESLPVGNHSPESREVFVESRSPTKPPRATPTIASEVVMERTEPIMQRAKPVAVEAVDLRELTRLPRENESRVPRGRGKKREEELAEVEMSAELENLSQASRKFLEVGHHDEQLSPLLCSLISRTVCE